MSQYNMMQWTCWRENDLDLVATKLSLQAILTLPLHELAVEMLRRKMSGSFAKLIQRLPLSTLEHVAVCLPRPLLWDDILRDTISALVENNRIEALECFIDRTECVPMLEANMPTYTYYRSKDMAVILGHTRTKCAALALLTVFRQSSRYFRRRFWLQCVVLK